MEKFSFKGGLAAILDLADVDTDQIIPKQFLKRVERSGYGEFLFYNHRYLPDGSLNTEFVLNQPRYAGAQVLLARENFGGGSSREHAPWALADYGFKVLIAPSFADIFKNNCLASGILTVELPAAVVEQWFQRVRDQVGYTIQVDLEEQTLTGSDGFTCTFEIDGFRKRRLLEGLDDIALTLQYEQAIADYEQRHRRPWQAAVATPDPSWKEVA